MLFALRKKKYVNMVWKNTYRREFLINKHLYFKKGLLHEDEEWTPKVFINANKVYTVNEFFYVYLIRNDSISTGGKKIENAKHMIETCNNNLKYYSKLQNKKLRKKLLNSLVDLYLNAIYRGGLYDKHDIAEFNKFSKHNINSINTFAKYILLNFSSNAFDRIYKMKVRISR